jgi:P27 family predicted phage terminase small subunit
MKQRGRKSAAKLAVIVANVPASDHDRRRSSNNRALSSRDLPPSHLSDATKQWWAAIVSEHQLGEHELRVLTIACEAFDRREQAREALNKHGLSYTDDKGMVRARPEVAIERDSAIRFLRAMRELNLNAEPPDHNKNSTVGLSWRDLDR